MAALKNEKMNKSRTLKTESKTYQVATIFKQYIYNDRVKKF